MQEFAIDPFAKERELSDYERRVLGYRIATAEILYHMPDHPKFLQSYIWQDLDLAPRFPVLRRFLKFWEDNLDGKLHSVKVAATELVQPAEFRFADGEVKLH